MFHSAGHSGVPSIGMILLCVVCLVKDKEVDLIDFDERMHQTLV